MKGILKTLIIISTFVCLLIGCKDSSTNPQIEDSEIIEELRNSIDLYPLHLNDVWVYQVDARLQPDVHGSLTEEQCNFTYLIKCNIINRTTFEDVEFYQTSYHIFFSDTVYKDYHAIGNHPIGGRRYNYEWIGVDSSDTKVYNYSPSIPSKSTIFNLAMSLNEILDIDLYWYGDISVNEIGNEHIFYQDRKYKVFQMPSEKIITE